LDLRSSMDLRFSGVLGMLDMVLENLRVQGLICSDLPEL
jgi:hypothetical protein